MIWNNPLSHGGASVEIISTMTLLIISGDKDSSPWVDALTSVDDSVEVCVWPCSDTQAEDVEFVLCWNHPRGLLREFPKLRGISSMGAGIDHLVSDPDLPVDLAFARLVDPSLTQAMFEYIHAAALYYQRDMDSYRRQQDRRQWQPLARRPLSQTTISIMGLGALGHYAAVKLSDMGFRVEGWSSTKKQIDGVTTYAEAQLKEFLGRADILVCLLPLTTKTQGILNAELFSALPPRACLINVARGGHVVESDLLDALENGSLRGAYLDVFQYEPLPDDHPFWHNERIIITPHSSSVTDPLAVAPQIIENYHRALSGRKMLNQIDIKREY
ncbi:MAG: glyoxylate/hydroxypyruvate reductase A [Halioglobus sp.]